MTMRFDLIIRNGLVFDGSGAPPTALDVGIKGGVVAALAPCLSDTADSEIDATGLWVTPGFVDIHTHYDIELELSPGLSESIRHGVTTVIIGNCSLSTTVGAACDIADMFARVETIPLPLLKRWLAEAKSWDSPQAYIQHLHSLDLGPHVAPLAGHSALRSAVMGLERSLGGKATDKEIAAICQLADDALRAGCIGISADMVPWHMMSGAHRGRTIPSQHASMQEYKALAEVCRRHDKVFQITPNPQKPLSFLRILAMATGISRQPLRLTVLSAIDSVCNRNLWRLFPLTCRIINGFLGGNLRFQSLTEPFTVFSHGPITPYFEEFSTGIRLIDAESHADRRRLWLDPAFRASFRKDWQHRLGRTFHRDFNLMTVVSSPESTWEGKSIAALAAADSRDALEWFMDALCKYDRQLVWEATGANDRPSVRHRLLTHPEILPGFTDAGAHLENLGYYDGALSLIKQALDTGMMTPAQAIRRVTAEPAEWFRLAAGTLALGGRADINILDPRGLRLPISRQEFVFDTLLSGGSRVVRRGSADIVKAVFVRGSQVVCDGEPLANLGLVATGVVLAQEDNLAQVASDPRLRIGASVAAHPFRDYWQVFVLKHTHPVNIALHAIGMAIPFLLIIASVATSNYWLLVLMPLCQLTGLVGHFVFERNHIDRQDAFFSWRAVVCLWKMFFLVATGRYGPEVRRVTDELESFAKISTPSASSSLEYSHGL